MSIIWPFLVVLPVISLLPDANVHGVNCTPQYDTLAVIKSGDARTVTFHQAWTQTYKEFTRQLHKKIAQSCVSL